jgi:hypothetical protein
VRTADARSWDIDRPDGVVRSLQVREYKVEPSEAVLARYLLSNDDSRSAGGDESEPLRPEVPLVGEASPLSGLRERLTRAASGPHVDVVGPSGVAQGAGPDSDAGEEVALSVAGDVGGLEVSDRSFIDDSCRDLPRGDEVACPRRRVRVVVVVVRGRQRLLKHELAAPDADEARRRAAELHVEGEVARDHRLRRPRRRGQPRARQRGDLAGLEGARRGLA